MDFDIANIPEGFTISSPNKTVYEIKKKLGFGAFGTVYQVINRATKENFALKIGYARKEQFADQLSNEIAVYKYINNSKEGDDLQYFGKYIDSFKNDRFVVIILELYIKDIYEHIRVRKYKGFALPDVQRILRDIASGMKILHNINIIHSDLKPENIVVATDGHVKIIDFGSSVPKQLNLSGYVQSRYYRAPEIFLKYKFTSAIDVWSFGCIAFELYIGYPLFYGKDTLSMLQLMQVRLGKFSSKIIRNSPCSKEFFENENVKDYANVADELNFGHKSLPQILFGRPTEQPDEVELFYDLVKNCLNFNPESRPSFDNIVNDNFLNIDFSEC